MTIQKLRPAHVDGFRLECWNELDATVKNNLTAATTAENMAVPTGATIVRIQADQDIWYNLTTTAVIPINDAGTSSFLPAGVERWIAINSTVTNISIVSAAVTKAAGWFWTS